MILKLKKKERDKFYLRASERASELFEEDLDADRLDLLAELAAELARLAIVCTS